MSERINSLFSDISSNYDTMNHVLSFGIDTLWRRKAAKAALLPGRSYRVLDIATGTGDLAIAVRKAAVSHSKSADITAMDFNLDMLKIAKSKASNYNIKDIKFETGDALKMKYMDESFDVLTSAFALRNFDDLDSFLKEAYRILRPNGKVVFLDMAIPDSFFEREFFRLYSRFMLIAGSLVDVGAYAWLVKSIKNFDKKRLAQLAAKNKFKNVKITNLTSGIAYLLTAEK
jgi:demethylmenaquinone methyltransferase/2-methoxy-6-polyprenyl-1,4-benzoquinol methylase